MRFLLTLVTLGLLVVPSHADTYLHFLRGSNNRLDEANRDRSNGNRLFDSQNNNRGGVNAGNYADREYYYEGSIIPLTWTVQHGCGSSIGSCQMILQYMCDPEIRNGIPDDNNGNPTITEKDEPNRGRHESVAYYQRCRRRERNKGLFTADQDMRGRDDARFTRQSNNGNRNGLECPEERDYYPYWDPDPWIDVAILTTNTERCPAYQAESQNVKGRWYCDGIPTPKDPNANGYIPITQNKCISNGGQWLYAPPKNQADPTITVPDCQPTQISRDNHHGNVIGSRYTAQYNWTVPATSDASATYSCVFRIRYNMTSGDFPYGGFDSWTTLGAGIDWNANQDQPDAQNIQNQNNNQYYEPSRFDIWSKYGFNFTHVAQSFRRPQNNAAQQVLASTYASRGYVWKGQQADNNNPQQRFPWVNIFGSLVPQANLFLQLRINTDQYGRTFEDRSHVFSIRPRMPQHRGLKIYNVGVRGRRGNIVQCYPATEYMFWPERLELQVGDLVHFQWTGSDNAGQNDGQAPANKDRNNVVILRKLPYGEFGADHADGIDPNSIEHGHLGQFYPGLINMTNSYPFLGLGFSDLQRLALQGLNFSYFDLGPRQVTQPGIYSYLSTRNSAFSNRNQAATIVVTPRNAADPLPQGMDLSYQDPTSSDNGYGWLDLGDYNTVGAVTGSKLEMIDMGVDGDSHVHYVRPAIFTWAVNASVTVNVKHVKKGLNIGYMYWRASPTDSWVELPNYSDSGDVTSYTITPTTPVQGGYYKVMNRPNSPAIAGVVIGILLFLALCTAIFWKIRVQPMGGWSIWWSSVRPSWCPTWGGSPASLEGKPNKKGSYSVNQDGKQRLAEAPKTPQKGPMATPANWSHTSTSPASWMNTTQPPATQGMTPADLPTTAPPMPKKQLPTYSTAAAAVSNTPTAMPNLAQSSRV